MTEVPQALLGQDSQMRQCVRELVLPRNKLANIDLVSVLRALPCLERLDLSQNMLENLVQPGQAPSEGYQNQNLKRLLLSRNLLTDLRPLAGVVLSSLQVLTLFGNYLDLPT